MGEERRTMDEFNRKSNRQNEGGIVTISVVVVVIIINVVILSLIINIATINT